MKISVLAPDLSQNCLGRAYLLAKILQRRYKVEIVGPLFGNGIWEPVADDKDIIFKFVKIRGRFNPYWQMRELTQKIDGDVIYASKPLFTSFGIGLLKKISKKKPLILDIDDWQMGFMKEGYRNLSISNRFEFWIFSTIQLYSMGSYWNNWVGEKASRFANEITVSNNFLKEKFGGTIVWHGRDTEAFNPEKFDKNLIREKYKIEKAKKVVMFFGTPRLHKGIEDLIKAIGLIKNQNIILVIVGIDKDRYCQHLVKVAEKTLNKRFKGFSSQSFKKVPEFLTMADVIAVPQRRNLGSGRQVPAKIFDAMAMAKPIVATNVSDLSEILDDCGWIVEPKNSKQLSTAIQYVFDHSQEAEEMGRKARRKCIEKYSWDVIEKILVNIFSKYE